MSIDTCKLCGSFVDSDNDPDCYQPDARMSLKHNHPDVCICERCREKEKL